MRLDINLASQPYEDARQFWLRWGTALAGGGDPDAGPARNHRHGLVRGAARPRHRSPICEPRLRSATRPAQQAEDFLNQPENRTTRDQSQFLNELIERKSFSWTRVLEDLEKVMPPRVHLVSIHPELDDGQPAGR